MATVGHLAVGLCAGRLHARAQKAWKARAAFFVGLSFLPDADVLAFALGIPYQAPFGHRGAAHSLAFAAGLAVLAWPLARLCRWPVFSTVALVFVTVGSHGLLDALTDGGLGIGLFWPLTDQRYFFPARPFPVAPIGVGMLSTRGLYVLAVEVLYFLPALAWALWPRSVDAVVRGDRA